jgi:hypothetical protein
MNTNIVAVKLLVHCLIVAIIFVFHFILNYSFSTPYTSFANVGMLNFVYLVFYITICTIFEFILSGSKIKVAIALIAYVLIVLVLVDCIELIIYKIMPAFGFQLFVESVERDINYFHDRIWRGFLFLNFCAFFYIIFFRMLIIQKGRSDLERSLRINRERAVDVRYTSHFLKSVLVDSFGEMLLSDKTTDPGTKSDIVQFLGYILEIENLGKKDTLNVSVSFLNCFVRLLKRHYGEKSIEVEYINDGSVYNDLPRGILIFPLENCIKHAKLSPDYPIKYSLIIAEGILHIKCKSYIHHFKQKTISGIGNTLLKEKLINSDYIEEVNHRSDDTFYQFDLKLIPSYVKKTKIQFAFFRR